MRPFILIMCLLFFLVACKSKDSVPGRILPPKKMQSIVWDMMRADQFLTDYVLNKDSSLVKMTESTKLYQQILALHDVSKEQFRKSFSYYQTHPALMKALMDSINKTSILTPSMVTTQPVLITDTIHPGSKTVPDTGKIRPRNID